MQTRILTVLLLVSGLSTVFAQTVPVDVQNSRLTIQVFKAGLFSAFGHNHEILAPLSSGSVDLSAKKVSLHFDARSLKVLDPKASPSDRAEIQSTMLSDKVLDSARFPDITFTSKQIIPTGGNAYAAVGELSLHGVTRAIRVPVSLTGSRYVGSVKLKQTDFTIKPVSFLGGTVKVKDEVRITFEIVLSHGAAQATGE